MSISDDNGKALLNLYLAFFAVGAFVGDALRNASCFGFFGGQSSERTCLLVSPSTRDLSVLYRLHNYVLLEFGGGLDT